MQSGIDILAIGDVVTDAFIKLLPHEAELDEAAKDHHPLLCMTYGTKIPFEEAIIIPAVGNSANAAVACARLGLNVAFYSNVGDDQPGRDTIKALHRHGVSTEYVHTNEGKKSNYHYVLWYGADRTILIKHEAYQYKLPKISLSKTPEWIYLSSIAESAVDLHDEISDYLKTHPKVKLAFQPGTFQIKLGAERLKQLYSHTEVLACNKEEAQLISGNTSTEVAELARALHKLGPKQVVITDGPKGSFASDGTTLWGMPIYPDPAPPYERTGAGDAYTSTYVAALADGQDMPTAMAWGAINSMSVVQKIGAQEGLLNSSGINSWLKKAPASFKATSHKLEAR